MSPTIHQAMAGDPRGYASLYVLGLLEKAESAAFEAHLQECRECDEEVRHARDLIFALAEATPQKSPSNNLRDRILKGL